MESIVGQIRKVDCHAHLWDLTRLHLPWLSTYPLLNRNYLLNDYLDESAKFNVSKAVYVEVDVDPTQRQLEIQFAKELCEDLSKVFSGAVVCANPADSQIETIATELSRSPVIKGIRHLLHRPTTPKGTGLEPNYIGGLKVLGSLNLSFDLCLRCEDLSDAILMADAVPETQFILNHCGNVHPKQSDRRKFAAVMSQLGRRANVACKLSGIMSQFRGEPLNYEDFDWVIDVILKSFPPDRVVWASDWPHCKVGGEISDWLKITARGLKGVPADHLDQLFYSNAVRVYKL